MNQFAEEDDYPVWLGDYLINDKFPWHKGLNTSFQEFQKKYTLHDSYLISLYYDMCDTASGIIAIHWDAVWLPDSIALSTSIVAEYPFLLIKIGEVREVSTSGYFNLKDGYFTIYNAQIESIDKRQLLIISSCLGGNVEITFLGDVIFLGLDRDLNILFI